MTKRSVAPKEQKEPQPVEKTEETAAKTPLYQIYGENPPLHVLNKLAQGGRIR